MRMARPGLVGMLAGLALAGCETPRERMMRDLGPAAQIASTSIDDLGWCGAGERIKSARFTAIVTTYDEAGKSYTDRQEMLVDFKADTITAVGGTPQGSWKAVADDDGKFKLKADKAVDNLGFSGGREISASGTKDLPWGMESITGCSIIEAESLDEAEKIARENPYVASIRVYEVREM